MDAGSLRLSREPVKSRNLLNSNSASWVADRILGAKKGRNWQRVRKKHSESKHKQAQEGEKQWLIQGLLIWYAPRETQT